MSRFAGLDVAFDNAGIEQPVSPRTRSATNGGQTA
jgi:hypothetical protein